MKKSRIIYILTALLCVFGILVSAAATKLGDLTGDGNVDANDAILLLQHSLFPDLYPLEYEGSVDFVKDESIDLNDAIYLLQHSLFPELYPIETRTYTVTFFDMGSPVDEIGGVLHGTFGGYPDYEPYYEVGYEKSYDNKFFDDYVEESYFGYDYGHKIDYEWYYQDENGKLVKYDENTVVTSDLEVHTKIKRVDVEVEIPKDIADVDEVLIFNAPYDSNSRFIDLWRDAFFFNENQVVSKLEETGIEDKMNEKLTEEGTGYFGDGGVLNDEFEISKTDFTYTLTEMIGSCDELSAIMTSDESVCITQENLAEAKSVKEMILRVATSEDIIRSQFDGDGADALIKRLPMHILEELYDVRVAEYLAEFEKAIKDVEDGADEAVIGGGIHFNIDLVNELLIPMLDHVKGVYADETARIANSDSNMASLIKAYHVDNPYATSFIDGYMEPELFLADKDKDGLYTVRTLPERYDNVLMPLKVETADALLWFTQKVPFEDVEDIIAKEENKALGLTLTNRINGLFDEYFEDGLPAGIVEYYKALTSDDIIASAIEMLDEGEEFDMEFFVETNVSYKLCEMLYMTIMRDLGVSDKALLGYNDTMIYTQDDYDSFIERMRLTWSGEYTTDMGIDEMIAKAGGEGDTATISFGGLSATLTRYIADSMFS